MRTYISQDWITLRGAGVLTISQSGHAWLDLPDVANAVAWLEVKDLENGGGTVTMSYQTSPEAEESIFVPMAGPTVTLPFTPTVGVNVTPMLKALLGNGIGFGSAASPLARWFRWQVAATGTFSSTWTLSFRLYLSVHCLDP